MAATRAKPAKQARATKAPGLESGVIANFSGGANLRDTTDELAANEAYGAYNCTFDERGGVASRLGYIKRNLRPLTPGYVATVLAATPDLYWRLDEASGTTAADTSGNNHAGSYGGGTNLVMDQPGALTGDPDGSLETLGLTGGAAVSISGYTAWTAGASRTYMGWANVSTTSGQTLMGSSGTVSTPGPALFVQNSAADVVFGTGGSNKVTWTGAWPAIGRFVFWAVTYNDSTRVAELFINGVSKGTRTVAAGFTGTATLLTIGYEVIIGTGDLGSEPGYLDEFAVFNSILTSATILGIYNAGLAASGDKIINDFYSPLLGVQLTQCGANLYRADSPSSVHTFTTTGCCTFAEFDNVVVVAHPVDGIWTSSDGTGWAKITATNAPTTGTLCIAAWMGRLFVGLSDGSVHWSDPATLSSWTSTNFNEIWTKDQQPVIALHVGSGQDIQGRAGLLAFKQDSCYRINDPTTGAYTVLSTSVGAGGPKAVVGVGARVCWIGKHGVYWWMENQAEPVDASDLIRPLWRAEQVSYANQAGWCAGRRLNRALFSLSSINSSVNDIALEFHPDEGWIAPRSDAMACYSMTAGNNELTFGGSPTVPGQCYQLDTGGTDDSQSIVGFFQTRWVVPNGGFECSLWQVRLHGRGTGTLSVLTDYSDTLGNQYAFSLQSTGVDYDNGVLYDDGVGTYAAVELQATEPFYNVATCREFSLRFDFTVNTTVAGRTMFGNVPSPTLGAFGVYQAEYLFVPLGLS